MERYTLQQRFEIIKIHYKNDENLVETVRKARFGPPTRWDRKTVKG